MVSEIVKRLRQVGCGLQEDPKTELIAINRELTISVVIARCHQTLGGSYRWRLQFDTGLRPDITVAVRMDAGNHVPLDYYLLPRIDTPATKLKLAEENGLILDGYRFDSLNSFYEFVRPISIMEAA